MSQGLCPSCGAAVNLTAGKTETKCQYCETVVTLQQAEAQLSEVKNSKFGGTLLLAELARKSGKYAEALRHYNKLIAADEKNAEGWLGHAFCTLRTYWCPTQGSGFGADDAEAAARDSDMAAFLIPCQTAINCAKNPGAMKKRLAKEIALFLADAKGWIITPDTIVSPKGGLDYRQLSKLLEFALETDPLSEHVAQTAVACAKAAQERLREEERDLAEEEAEAQEETSELGDGMDEEDIEEEKRDREKAKKAFEERRRSLSERKAAWRVKQDECLRVLGAINPEAAKKANVISVELEQEPKPSSQPQAKPASSNAKSGCFVATACYGDYDHPAVMELRCFRDEYLEASRAGRASVRWYYNWSPAFARLVTSSSALRALAKVVIVLPATLIARFVKWKSRRVSG